MVVLIVLNLGFYIFVLLAPYVCYHILVKFRWLSGYLLVKKLLIRLTKSIHGISTLLIVWFFPASVFGVGIFF